MEYNNLNSNIQLEGYNQLLIWYDAFLSDSLARAGLPDDTVVLNHIPYSYHEIVRELIRREDSDLTKTTEFI